VAGRGGAGRGGGPRRWFVAGRAGRAAAKTKRSVKDFPPVHYAVILVAVLTLLQIRNKILVSVAAWSLCPGPARQWLMRCCGAQIGNNVQIRPGGLFFWGRLTIGDGVKISEQWHLQDHAPITLGNRVRIGPGVRIITTEHPTGPHEQRSEDLRIDLPVVVKAGTRLGANVTILAGVTIGEGCVIAAGSVVIRDCEPDGLYAGVPATRKRDLPVRITKPRGQKSPAPHEQETPAPQFGLAQGR
jgi:maltose O-acetyltransferase